jgi:hypothetical protein
MASMADSVHQTTVFARNQQVMTNSATTQRADVFGRRDRRSSTVALPDPRRLTVRLPIDGEPIEFTYTDFGGGLPQWAEPVLQSLSERWGVRPGWDSYGARPTNPELVVRLLNVISDLLRDDSPPPQIMPLADGGVQAEWHRPGRDLEIVVPADESASYYYFNRATHVEEESELDDSYARVQDLIESLR